MTREFSLKEQRFVLRSLGQADVDKYLVFFNALSEESIRCRFGHLLASLSASAAKQRTNGNTEGEKTVAIFDQPQERIIAVGRCYLDGKTREAEIALVVADAMRRLGLARFLLRQLIQFAQDGAIPAWSETGGAHKKDDLKAAMRGWPAHGPLCRRGGCARIICLR